MTKTVTKKPVIKRGIVKIDVSEIVRSDIDAFFKILEERLGGGLLGDMSYVVVDHHGNSLTLLVQGELVDLG